MVQEIVRFLKVDTAFMNIRPLRYSYVIDSHPDSLPYVASVEAKRGLRLRDAILSSYHHNEVTVFLPQIISIFDSHFSSNQEFSVFAIDRFVIQI